MTVHKYILLYRYLQRHGVHNLTPMCILFILNLVVSLRLIRKSSLSEANIEKRMTNSIYIPSMAEKEGENDKQENIS